MSELRLYHVTEAYNDLNVRFVYNKDEADKVIAHHKYKRCLAMADVEWLKRMLLCNHPESISFRRAVKREHKWEALAEQYKEAK